MAHRQRPVAPLAAILLTLLTQPARGQPRDPLLTWGQGALLGRVERARPDEIPQRTIGPGGREIIDQDRYLSPSLDEERLLGFAGFGLGYALNDALMLNGALDTGGLEWREGEAWSNGRPLDEEIRDTLLVRALNLEITPSGSAFDLVVGKQLLRVGGGLIFDEYATGAELGWSVEALSVRAGAWIPGRGWDLGGDPIARARIAYAPDDFSEFSLSYTAARADEAATRLLDARLDRVTLGLKPEVVEGVELWLDECVGREAALSLWYLTARADLLLEGHTINATAILGGGEGDWGLSARAGCPVLEALEARMPATSRGYEVDSFALDARWRARISGWLYLTSRIIWLSGDGGAEDEGLTSFTAPAPLITAPVLFFGGGIGAAWGVQGVSLSGLNGRGVRAPVLSALLVPSERLELELLWAHLRVDRPLEGGRDHYGDEVDLKARLALDAMTLEGEAAAIYLGDVYPAPGPWWRLGLSVQRQWGD